MQKFGFVHPPLPEGYSHQTPANTLDSTTSRITPPPSPSRVALKAPSVQPSQTGFTGVNGGGEVINKLVAKRSNKKRIQPSFVGSLSGSVPSASTASNHSLPVPAASSSNGLVSSRSFGMGTGTRTTTQLLPLAHASSQPPSHSISPITDNWPHGYDADVDMSGPIDMDVPINSLSTGTNATLKGKRKASILDSADDTKLSKPRTLGGDRPRDTVVIHEIGTGESSGSGSWNDRGLLTGAILPVPPLYNSLNVRIDGSDDVLEGRNSENDGGSLTSLIIDSIIICCAEPTEVMLVNSKQTQWLDYLPSRIIAMTATTSFSAVAMQDGSVNVYSSTGRRYFLFYHPWLWPPF